MGSLKITNRGVTSLAVLISVVVISVISARAELIVTPDTLDVKAKLSSSIPQKLAFIGHGISMRVMYKILPAHSPSGAVLKAEYFKIKTPYTSNFQSLQKFRTIFSGSLKEEQIEALLRVDTEWNHVPGIYRTKLISNSGEREVPVKVTVLPQTVVTLKPKKFDLFTSNISAPVIQKIQLFVASNYSQWQIYCISEPLSMEAGGGLINTDRLYVRVTSPNDQQPWNQLNKPFKVAAGGPGSYRQAASIEFTFQARNNDQSGHYKGNFRFMIHNAP